MSSSATVVRSSSRRKLFAPTPIDGASIAAATTTTNGSSDGDAALAAEISASEARRSYSLRTRSAASSSTAAVKVEKRAAKRARAATPSDDSAGSDFDGASSDNDSDVFTESSPKSKATTTRRKSTKSTPSTSASARKSSSPKKPTPSPFDVSPRKPTKKPIKVNLEPHEAHPAPADWQTVYALLSRQRSRIVAPVDTMGCEENGRADRRADTFRAAESPEDSARRERLATLVSLMLSSQTKDPVTAEAVYNLQRNLPNGLCLESLLEASDDEISSCIAKVGFWRRKTGYLKSAARILKDDFGGDVPRTVDELCSLPGVGPKMAFLALSSMGIQIGIGVDTHVHRLTNRLGWHKTKTPEETRLNLQSWLPHELHGKINRLLVGFGQVICVPVGPRCDLCDVGRLCPSWRRVENVDKRVRVELLEEGVEGVWKEGENWVKVKNEEGEARVKVEVEGGVSDLLKVEAAEVVVKKEEADEDAVLVERALEW